MGRLTVNTAGGSIDTADLGVTLMHEHVFVMTTEITLNYPEGWGDEARREAEAVSRLNELKSRGVDTIVDLTVIGLGRYLPRIARVAERTELNIVVATGLYTYNDVPFYPQCVPAETVAAMAVCVREVVRAIQIPVGVNVLRNDGLAAVAVAAAAGAQFVRINVHTGLMAADTGLLRAWLARIDNRNAQREFYLTDVAALAVKDKVGVSVVQPVSPWEVLGVNSRDQLARLERIC